MIERVSRYYNGPLLQTEDKYTGAYVISVLRAFPQTKELRYILYTWKEGDTLAGISEQYGVGAKYWCEIMEINPDILDPFDIAPGTILKVPYGN
jgi:LysM repeat protein